MCDNIDALLADEGNEEEYDIGVEDEAALLEDNYDDQNLVSSSNRNYSTKDDLNENEEELDHEPEEPEDVLELDDESDVQEDDASDLNSSVATREKRDTKFVTERVNPNISSETTSLQKFTNKPVGRPQNFNNRNFQNFNNNNNTGTRGGRFFRGRGRGALGNRMMETGKKVLINPHFTGVVPFNNPDRIPWQNNGRPQQAWNQPNHMQQVQQQPFQPPPFLQHQQQMQHQQFQHPNQMQQVNHFAPNNNRGQMEFDRTMQAHQKPSVHQRLGNMPPPNPEQQFTNTSYEPPPQQQQQHFIAPFPQQQQQQQIIAPSAQQPQQQHVFMQPLPAANNLNAGYNQPPPVVQQPQGQLQGSYSQQQSYGGGYTQGESFNQPPPGYHMTYEQPQPQQQVQNQPQPQQNLFLPAQNEFHQPPPQPQTQPLMPQQLQLHQPDVQYQQMQPQLQQQVFQQPQQQMFHQENQPNIQPPQITYQEYQREQYSTTQQPYYDEHHQAQPQQLHTPFNSNLNNQQPDQRRVVFPKPTNQTQGRLGPPPNRQQEPVLQRPRGNPQQHNQQNQQNRQNQQRQFGNRGNSAHVISPSKRRYSGGGGNTGFGDMRKRRTAEVANLHEVATVDSTTTVAVVKPVLNTQPAIEEDEETRLYRQKIEQQKKVREQILAQKEERRRQAALKTTAAKQLDNLLSPAQILTQQTVNIVAPANTKSQIHPLAVVHPQSANKSNRNTTTTKQSNRIVNRPITVVPPTANKKEEFGTSTNRLAIRPVTTTQKDQSGPLSNRMVTKPITALAPPTAPAKKEELGPFLTNRRVIAKDQSLADTSIVVVSNLAAGTTAVKLRKLCQGVGDVQKLEMLPKERQATIQFKSVASAHAFFKKYQRYMIDLSMINVKLKT